MIAAEVDGQRRVQIVDFIRGVGEVTVMGGRYIDISAASCLISRDQLLFFLGVFYHQKSISFTLSFM